MIYLVISCCSNCYAVSGTSRSLHRQRTAADVLESIGIGDLEPSDLNNNSGGMSPEINDQAFPSPNEDLLSSQKPNLASADKSADQGKTVAISYLQPVYYSIKSYSMFPVIHLHITGVAVACWKIPCGQKHSLKEVPKLSKFETLQLSKPLLFVLH